MSYVWDDYDGYGNATRFMYDPFSLGNFLYDIHSHRGATTRIELY